MRYSQCIAPPTPMHFEDLNCQFFTRRWFMSRRIRKTSISRPRHSYFGSMASWVLTDEVVGSDTCTRVRDGSCKEGKSERLDALFSVSPTSTVTRRKLTSETWTTFSSRSMTYVVCVCCYVLRITKRHACRRTDRHQSIPKWFTRSGGKELLEPAAHALEAHFYPSLTICFR